MSAHEASREATLIQRQAADPRESVVLSASAGSGKTKVLVDRFLRLCIEDTRARSHPRAILAVTFTKKAAVEIQERLLKAARGLALDAPVDVEDRLEKLFGRKPKDAELRHAADLYERILEDTAGLNVGTIHSFCQNVLGRFAAEAGLDPRFTVLEDTADLVEEALDQLAAEISRSSSLSADAALVAPTPDALRGALKKGQEQALRLNRWMAGHQEPAAGEALLPPWNRAALLPHLLEDLREFLLPDGPADRELEPRELLPLMRDALQRFLDQGLPQLRADLAEVWNDSMDKTAAKLREQVAPWPARLEALLDADPPADPARISETLDAVKNIFLTGEKARAHSRLRKVGLGDAFNGGVVEQALGILELCRMHDLLHLYRRNAALLRLLLRLLDIMDELKRRDRVIDFQDLEDLACRLMDDPGRALGLLHRLDDSLHHILLDEFQDTNFNQWDLMRHLVEDFLSGDATDGTRKSVFVVGDVKQSIYGFRAAEPALFGQVEEQFRHMEGLTLQLPTNFRSLRAVVDSVGCVFNQPPLKGHYTQEQQESARQLVFRTEPAGRAGALPLFEPEPEDERSCDQLAATAAARLVRNLVEGGAMVHGQEGGVPTTRPLNYGDVRVLCRGRTHIATYEKIFRSFGIPLTPAGRGMLAASREVQDILALLRWLAYPADEVALATVLRSPIFRLSEARLQEVLAARGLRRLTDGGSYLPPRNLWDSLRRTQDPVTELLRGWRARVGQEDAHALLRRIFQEGFVLERYEAALGPQARQNLMRLFDLSLAPEVAATPTIRQLGDVIERAARRGTEEEADTPTTGEEGRVLFMTIHGAKGLQAPVVLLADAARPPSRRENLLRINRDPDSPLLFMVKKSHHEGYDLVFGPELPPHPIRQAGEAAAAQAEAEAANLLYVAMTRAQEQLFLLGGGKSPDRIQDSMLQQVRDAAQAGGCATLDLEDPPEISRPPEAPPANLQANGAGTRTVALPSWWLAPTMGQRYRLETPSDTGEQPTGPLAGVGEDRSRAMERGTRVHLLLQLAAQAGRAVPGTTDAHREAAAVFAAHDDVFRPGERGGRGLCEAPVIVRRPPRRQGELEVRITGSIDRLVVWPDRVDIIDYKTNRTGGDAARLPELCAHYQPQLRSYREAVAPMFPGKEIRTWLLFTDPDLPGGQGLLQKVATG